MENDFPEKQFPKHAAKTQKEFGEGLLLVFDTMIKFKKVMLKKGLTRARAKCPKPDCSGMLHGALLGPKKHMHFHCDTCDMKGME